METSQLADYILKFLNSSETVLELGYILPVSIQAALLALDYKRTNIDTNGWDIDFWVDFKKGDEKLVLSGGWFYGKYKLTKEEKEYS